MRLRPPTQRARTSRPAAITGRVATGDLAIRRWGYSAVGRGYAGSFVAAEDPWPEVACRAGVRGGGWAREVAAAGEPRRTVPAKGRKT